MNKKAGLSLLILEIVGGVIVVVIMMSIFSGFAIPYLKFLVDQENINSFNKFSNVLKDSCDTGTGTSIYFGITPETKRKPYAWGLVFTQTASEISDKMPECGKEGNNETCVTSQSKNIINRCKEDFCWCLFNLEFNPGYCYNNDYKGITIDTGAIGDAPDYESSGTDLTLSGTAIKIYKDNQAAQIFKMPKTGIITEIKLVGYYPEYESCTAAELEDVVVKIYGLSDVDGKPRTNDVFGTAVIKPGDIGKSIKVITAEFAGAYLTANKEYAIVISSQSDLSCSFALQHTLSSTYEKDAYQGGFGDWSPINGDYKFNIIYKEIETFKKLQSWDEHLSQMLSDRDNYHIKKVRVLQCVQVREQMGCEKENFPLLPLYTPVNKEYSDQAGLLVWVHPKLSSDEVPIKLRFDSFSVDRGIDDNGQLAYWLDAHPSPDFKIEKHTQSNSIALQEEC